jgi:hypothetical protein
MQIYNKIVPKHSQPNKKNINEASFLKSVTDFTVLLLQFPPFFHPAEPSCASDCDIKISLGIEITKGLTLFTILQFDLLTQSTPNLYCNWAYTPLLRLSSID